MGKRLKYKYVASRAVNRAAQRSPFSGVVGAGVGRHALAVGPALVRHLLIGVLLWSFGIDQIGGRRD